MKTLPVLLVALAWGNPFVSVRADEPSTDSRQSVTSQGPRGIDPAMHVDDTKSRAVGTKNQGSDQRVRTAFCSRADHTVETNDSVRGTGAFGTEDGIRTTESESAKALAEFDRLGKLLEGGKRKNRPWSHKGKTDEVKVFEAKIVNLNKIWTLAKDRAAGARRAENDQPSNHEPGRQAPARPRDPRYADGDAEPGHEPGPGQGRSEFAARLLGPACGNTTGRTGTEAGRGRHGEPPGNRNSRRLNPGQPGSRSRSPSPDRQSWERRSKTRNS